MHFKEENITGNKLTHMIHNEDLIWYGSKAINLMYNALEDVFEMLEGSSEHKMKTTMKIDGAPSAFCASDYMGRSFVSTKGIFAKTPKIAFTEADCDELYVKSPDLADKMKQLLKWVPSINIPKDEIWQGDFLFAHNDLKKETIDNEEYITFKPNTIIYAVPINDPIAKTIVRSNIGICWHTRYKKNGEKNKISFDADVHELQNVPTVFQMDVNIPNIAGRVTLTEDETTNISSKLIILKKNLNIILQDPLYMELINDTNIINYIMGYENFVIKNEGIQSLAEDDIQGIIKKFFEEEDKAIAKLKKQDAISRHEAKKAAFKKKIEYFSEIILKAWKIQQQIVYIKEFFIKKLNNLSSMKTYVQYADKGYIPCSGEGFAISDVDGNVQKLVSRLEFSKNNFSQEVIKGWTNERRENESIENLQNILREEIENIIEPLLDKNGLENKKEVTFTNKGLKRHYIVQPKKDPNKQKLDPKEREYRAQDFLNDLNQELNPKDINFKSAGSGGRTPIIDASIINSNGEKEEVNIIFKPRDDSGGQNANSTEADETYWAYCMALYQNNRGNLRNLLPQKEEDLINLDLSFLNLKKDQYPNRLNFKGYTEGTKEFCDKYLDPNEDYLFFREEKTIDTSLLELSNNKKCISPINSLHTLINYAAYEVMSYGFKKDVWNPADIIACKKSFYTEFVNKWNSLLENAESGNFGPFNKYLLECMMPENKNLFCVSLKDIPSNNLVYLSEFNTNLNEDDAKNEDEIFTLKEIKVPSMVLPHVHSQLFGKRSAAEISFKILDSLNQETKFQYRAFGAKSPQLEGTAAGAGAHLGKSGIGVLCELYDTYQVGILKPRSFKEANNLIMQNPEILKDELETIRNCHLPIDQAGGRDFTEETWLQYCKEEPLNEQELIAKNLWPRYIDFLYLLASQENNLNPIFNKIMKGCTKAIKGCAPFIKLGK